MAILLEAPPAIDLAGNSARLIRMRWIAGVVLLAATLVCVYALDVPLPATGLYALGIAILGYNALIWWLVRTVGARQPRLIPWQIGFDWLALAMFVHLTGGAESPAITFFLFHLLIAAILLPGRNVYYSAAAVVLLVGLIVGLELIGVVPHVHVLPALPTGLYQDPLYAAAVLAFFATTIVVTATLVVPILDELREHERRLEALYRTSQAVGSSLNLDTVLDQLCDGIKMALQVKAGSIRLLDETGQQLRLHTSCGLSPQYLEKGPVDVAHSAIDREALRGAPVIVVDAAHDARLQYPAEMAAEGLHSVICVPLMGRKGPLGVLRAYGGRPNMFQTHEAEFVAAIARLGALAIENAMAYGELQRTDETKSRFVRTVTHELRAPVSGAQTLLRTVMRGLAGGLNDTQRGVLARLDSRLNTLQALIDDLLDLAAGKVVGLEVQSLPVPLLPALQRVIDRLAPQAQEKGVALQLHCTTQDLSTMASDDGLARVFLNLVGNAVKYTPSGGKVDVTLSRQDGEALIAVADTGIGIPEAELPHIFEEFYRATNAKAASVTGTGLGLAIVKDLVEHYGGHVRVDSQVGQGTTFRVSLKAL